ncbi:MAG: hypothetical protein MJ204_10120 [Bacteroidales bacterium]|nr:hypothetical protein [Bacteroidales bacterium]
MKHFFKTIAMFCLGACTMASCGDEPIPEKQEEEVKLEVSKTELGFSQKADSKVVSVTTTGVWYVENNSDWISISPMGGKGNGAITVSVSQNASGQSRESYFSVAIDSDSKVIVVSQSATDTSEEENNGEETGDKDENGENGVIKAAFSVSADKQVYFSQGNLQYQASTKTWRFAEHQYDMIGDANKNISSTYNGWIDLFGWGTSGYNSKYPYMTSTDYSDYGVVGDKYADIAGTNFDWGVYNKISNGGNVAGQWRTLTYEEWDYVFEERADASSLKGLATVNGVTGLILLPDNWTTPGGITFKSGMNGFDSNTYSTSEWSKMEANGAIFLPAAGNRSGTDVNNVGSNGYYWSSTAYDYDYAGFLLFYSDGACTTYDGYRSYGRSVRLVRGL